MMKMLSACVLVVFCFAACSRKGLPQAGTISHVDSSYVKKDSTWTDRKEERDTIYLPGDSVQVLMYIKCDSITNKPKDATIIVDSKHSKLDVQLRNGILKVKSKYDSVMQITIRQKEIIHTLSEALVKVSKQKQETIVKVEYQTHWYDQWARGISLFVLFFLILYIVIKNLKPKFI